MNDLYISSNFTSRLLVDQSTCSYPADCKKTVAISRILREANGKSETRLDAETGILKSETETEKFSDLIESIYVTDRHKI